jgi:hypothetical protein
MDYFYIIVLSVAIVLLIIILTYIGIAMTYYKSNSAKIYPPVANTCPDYWNISSDGSGCIIPYDSTSKNYSSKLLNELSSGVVPNNAFTINWNNIDMSMIRLDDLSMGSYGGAIIKNCGKQNWANYYGIEWDGVSNYNNC